MVEWWGGWRSVLPPRPSLPPPRFCFLRFLANLLVRWLHTSRSSLWAAALCWGESITGVGSAALEQSPGRPSPACGDCVTSFEGRAEPVRKLLAPKCFPRSLSWALGFGVQLSGVHCFGSFEFPVWEVHPWEWWLLASSCDLGFPTVGGPWAPSFTLFADLAGPNPFFKEGDGRKWPSGGLRRRRLEVASGSTGSLRE